MTWTTPVHRTPGTVASSTDENAQVIDNLIHLLSGRNPATTYQGSGSDYNLTVATTWTSIDTTNMACTITTQSGRVKLWAIFNMDPSVSGACQFDWLNNNTSTRCRNNNIGSGQWVVAVQTTATPEVQLTVFSNFTGLTVNTSYTFYVQYYKTSGTVNIKRSPIIVWAEEY